jgi:hypothetical protein
MLKQRFPGNTVGCVFCVLHIFLSCVSLFMFTCTLRLSLPLHVSHSHAQSQSHCVLETQCPLACWHLSKRANNAHWALQCNTFSCLPHNKMAPSSITMIMTATAAKSPFAPWPWPWHHPLQRDHYWCYSMGHWSNHRAQQRGAFWQATCIACYMLTLTLSWSHLSHPHATSFCASISWHVMFYAFPVSFCFGNINSCNSLTC